MLRLPWDLHFHGHDFSETVLIAPLGIAFVFFWPVWLFTGRPARAERLCLGFAIATFLLWGWLSPFVRYALAPLAVLALLTGMRLARFWRASPLITRASLAAACLWVLIPAVCATMIVEINAPQLRYVAGAIGRDEYLSQALNTYRFSRLAAGSHQARGTHPGSGELLRRLRAAVPALPVQLRLPPLDRGRSREPTARRNRSIGWWRLPAIAKPTWRRSRHRALGAGNVSRRELRDLSAGVSTSV